MKHFVKNPAFAFFALVLISYDVANGIIVEYNFPAQDRQQPANEKQIDQPNFHEVDAFGDDYVDFGARTGENGAFYWHANYPVEDRNGRQQYQSGGDDFKFDFKDE